MLDWLGKTTSPDPLSAMRNKRLTGSDLECDQTIGKIDLHIDPSAKFKGSWCSPEGRLVELDVKLETAPRWIGVHIDLPNWDVLGLDWFGFALRHGASKTIQFRAALRSHMADGAPFHDHFFSRDLVANASASDHYDLIAPSHVPDLPPKARRRELVLFLPTILDFRWSLHDLRFIGL